MRARNRELLLLIPASLLVTAGFAGVFIQRSNVISNVSLTYGAIFLGLCLAGHVFLRVALPQADPFLFPLLYQVGLGYSPIQSGLLMMPQAIAAMSLNLLLGYTGQLSLGHVAFFGIGAYASALVSLGFEWRIDGDDNRRGVLVCHDGRYVER